MSVERFTLVVPCSAGLPGASCIHKCTLSVDVDISGVVVALVVQPFAVHRFAMSEFDSVSISESTIILSGKTNLILCFFKEIDHLERVMRTLATAGVLIPKGRGTFSVIEHVVKIPNGEFRISGEIIDSVVCESIAETMAMAPVDASDAFVDATLPFIYRRRWSQAVAFFEENDHMIASRTQATKVVLFRWLGVSTCERPRKADNEELAAEIVASSKAKKDIPGGIEIARRIAQLVIDEKGEASVTVDECVKIFLRLTELITRDFVKKTQTIAVGIIRRRVPEVIPFMERHGLIRNKAIVGGEVEIGNLFATRFQHVWNLWRWIFRADNHGETIATFVASIWLIAVGRGPNKSGEWDWLNVLSTVKLGEAMNFATYMTEYGREYP